MSLEFQPPPLARMKAKMIASFANGSNATRAALLLSVLILATAIIFSGWKIASQRSKSRFSVPTANSQDDYDPINPNPSAAPVDLTTIGAATDLPEDHPIRKMNGKRPAELSAYHGKMADALANEFESIDSRLKILERKNER